MQAAQIMQSYSRPLTMATFTLSMEELATVQKAVYHYWQRFFRRVSTIRYEDCLQDVLTKMLTLKQKPISLHNAARWILYAEYIGHGGSKDKKTYFYSKTHNTMPLPLILTGEDEQLGNWFNKLVTDFYTDWKFQTVLADVENQRLYENLWAVGGPIMYRDVGRFLEGNKARTGKQRKGTDPDLYDTTLIRRAVRVLKAAYPTQADLVGELPAVRLSVAAVTNLVDYAIMTGRLNRIAVPYVRKYHRQYDIKRKNYIVGEFITTPEHRAFLERQIMRGIVEKTSKSTWRVRMDSGREGYFTEENVALEWLKDQTVEELCLACGHPRREKSE